jgi:hypothetical protein
MTWAAVAGGQALGCTIANLQASQVGRLVYEGMGFEHAYDYQYVYPPGSQAP